MKDTLGPTLDRHTGALCEGSSDRCHQPEQVYLEYPKPEGSHYCFLWNDECKKFGHFSATFSEEWGSYLSGVQRSSRS